MATSIMCESGLVLGTHRGDSLSEGTRARTKCVGQVMTRDYSNTYDFSSKLRRTDQRRKQIGKTLTHAEIYANLPVLSTMVTQCNKIALRERSLPPLSAHLASDARQSSDTGCTYAVCRLEAQEIPTAGAF